MMQERKIRLDIFVVIGLLVGGIILDALSVGPLLAPAVYRIFLRRKGRCRKKMRHSRRRTTTCVRTMWNSLP